MASTSLFNSFRSVKQLESCMFCRKPQTSRQGFLFFFLGSTHFPGVTQHIPKKKKKKTVLVLTLWNTIMLLQNGSSLISIYSKHACYSYCLLLKKTLCPSVLHPGHIILPICTCDEFIFAPARKLVSARTAEWKFFLLAQTHELTI